MAAAAPRPEVVRVLSAFLLLQAAVGLALALLSLVALVVSRWSDRLAAWADLVLVVLMLSAVAGLITAAPAMVAWVLVRRRRAGAVPVAVLAHLVPVVLVLWFAAHAVGQGPTVAAVVAFAAAGILLALAPATRAWLRADPAG
jgi:hypothetical protein